MNRGQDACTKARNTIRFPQYRIALRKAAVRGVAISDAYPRDQPAGKEMLFGSEGMWGP